MEMNIVKWNEEMAAACIDKVKDKDTAKDVFKKPAAEIKISLTEVKAPAVEVKAPAAEVKAPVTSGGHWDEYKQAMENLLNS